MWDIVFKDIKVKNKFFSTNKKVIIAGHTNTIETIIVQKAIEKLEPNVKNIYTILVNSKIPSLIFNFLHLKYIPVIKNGFVKNTIQRFSDKNKYTLIWYPSGGGIKWKTGAFVFAMKTKSTIFHLGIDYKNHQLVIDSFLDEKNILDMKKSKEIISQYTPYNKSSDEAFSNNKQNGSLFTFNQNILLLVLLSLYYYYQRNNIIMTNKMISLIIIIFFNKAILIGPKKTINLSEPIILYSMLFIILF